MRSKKYEVRLIHETFWLLVRVRVQVRVRVDFRVDQVYTFTGTNLYSHDV